MRRILGQGALILLILVVMLEATSHLYIRFFNQNVPLPTYSLVNAGSRFWVCIDKHFGVWHEPNSSYLHNKSCFVVTYRANGMGMRDKERQLVSGAPRVAMLGDSFVEGWGVEQGQRASDLLEQGTGREVLNFGTSGGFGTVQEWQQYKHLVSRFDHDVVLLGILPHNDFMDNDYDLARKQDDDNYRPYLVGDYPNMALTYHREQLPVRGSRVELLKSFDFTLREWSAFYRVMRYLGSFRLQGLKLVPRWVPELEAQAGRQASKYYDFTPRDWDVMRYSLERIAEEAKGRKVIVFTIPVHPDFLRYDGTEPPLARNLARLAQERGFVYVDLLKEMSAKGLKAQDVFFVCDNHWSPRGNEVAASLLLPHVQKALDAAKVGAAVR